MFGWMQARGWMAAGLMAWSSAVWAGAIAQLDAFVRQVASARGEFVQRQLTGGADGRPLRVTGASSGDFMFLRPGRFVWRYVTPYAQQLLADGQMLYLYDKDLNQVTQRRLDASLGESPAAILFGGHDLARAFVLKEAGARDGIDWVELRPRARDTQFERIAVGFKAGELEGMELRDALGNTTLLTFSRLQKNPRLPLGAFRFVPPEGVDVIEP